MRCQASQEYDGEWDHHRHRGASLVSLPSPTTANWFYVERHKRLSKPHELEIFTHHLHDVVARTYDDAMANHDVRRCASDGDDATLAEDALVADRQRVFRLSDPRVLPVIRTVRKVAGESDGKRLLDARVLRAAADDWNTQQLHLFTQLVDMFLKDV